jgi:hypothetical protein
MFGLLKVDERHISEYRIMHQGKEVVENEGHHYPFSGGVNPVVRLAVVALDVDDGGERGAATTTTMADDPSSSSATVKAMPSIFASTGNPPFLLSGRLFFFVCVTTT